MSTEADPNPVNFAFHHFFVFVEQGAPVVDYLASKGFTEGPPNRHPGQGTANRRIFFTNGMLEFIWIENFDDVTSNATAATKLWERSQYKTSGYSPFGICIYRGAGQPKDEGQMPFDGWAYRPHYLPPDKMIWQASNDLCPWEPQIFYLPFAHPFKNGPFVDYQRHANGCRSIEVIEITMKAPEVKYQSNAVAFVSNLQIVEFIRGQTPFARIKLTGCAAETLPLGHWCPVTIDVTM
jgi:hypothetical protein